MKYIITLFTFLAVANIAANAQPQRDLPEQEFTIEREYKPVLADAVKVNFNPDLPSPDTSTPVLRYNIPSKYLNIPYTAPDVRPLAMRPVPPANLKNVYAKIGVGNKALPYLDLYVNSGRTESNQNAGKFNVGAHVGYLNAPASPLEYQKFSDLRTRLFSNYYTDKIAFGADLNYDRDVVYFYGFNPEDTTVFPSDIRQRFNFFNVGLGLHNTNRNDANISYFGRFDMNYLNDLFGEKESNPVFNVGIRKDFENRNFASANILVDHSSYTDNTFTKNNTIVNVNPAYRLNKEDWYITAGINTGVSNAKFFIYPDVTFERELIGKAMVFNAGINGRTVKNNFKTLSDINPFVSNGLEINNSKEFGLSAAIKGAPIDKLTYNAKVAYNNVDFLPLFVIDTINARRFDVVYDTSAFVLNLHGEIGYNFSEKLRIIIAGDYFHYTLRDEAQPWHLPTAKASVHTIYNITDKISAGADLYFINSTFAKTATGAEEKLPGIVDINFNASYKISESFHIFANVNNIASAKHKRWYNYPSYGMNAVGDITLNF